MSVVQIFDSIENREYFLDDENMLWLHGTLLCNKLNFKNPGRDIQLHTEKSDRRQVNLEGRLVWFVNEPGTWSMIISSKTKESQTFKIKLCNEILPNIRKTGMHVDKSRFSEDHLKTLELLIEERDAQLRDISEELETRSSRLWRMHELVHPLASDVKSLYQSKCVMLLLGGYRYHETNNFTTFKQVVNTLQNMGFTYSGLLMLRAIAMFCKRRDIKEKFNLLNFTQELIDRNDIKDFMECIFISMGGDKDSNDSINFYYEFGVGRTFASRNIKDKNLTLYREYPMDRVLEIAENDPNRPPFN